MEGLAHGRGSVRLWVASAGVLLLAACSTRVVSSPGPGDSPGPRVLGTLVVDGEPPAQPYDGPMVVPVDDLDDPSVLARSGAAGRALECEGPPSNGGKYDNGPFTVHDSAKAALAGFDPLWGVPRQGYRVEREDDGRVLFSLDVDRRSRAVLIAAGGIADHTGKRGWTIETWAVCDPSEWPAAVAEELGVEVWRDAAGRRVPQTKIQSGRGHEHCDTQDVTFLWLGDVRDGRQFVGHPTPALADHLATTFDATATLPRDAIDTGFRFDGRQLWLDPDRTAAYLVNEGDREVVERWPAAKQPILCA